MDKEKSAENASGLYIVSDKTANEEDTQKLIDVFDDTMQSLQIGNPTGLYITKLFFLGRY